MDEKLLQDLQVARKKALDDAEAITASAKEQNRGITADDAAKVTAYLADAERCKQQLEDWQRAKTLEAQITEAKTYDVPVTQRAVAEPPPARTEEGTARVELRENPHATYQKGDAFGAICAARIKFAGYEHQRAVLWARQMFGESAPQTRALQQTSFTAGGALIPENFVGSEFIEMLKATAAVRRAGARQVQLINGSFTTPKLTGGVTGAWLGAEGDNITTSEPTFGQLKLVEKKYGVIVPFSNDLRRNASLDAIRIVRDDLLMTAANDEDIAFLNGTGLNGQPKGAYNWIPAGNKGNQTGTSLANVRTDIRRAKNALDNNHVPERSRAWFMHSRTINYLAYDLVDGNSNFAFPSLHTSSPTVDGSPVYKDNNISITLNTNQSQVFYLEMSECYIGDSMELEIEVFENGVYSQSGTLRSGISRDESCIRLIRKTDFGMRHDVAGFVLEQVTLGA